MNTKLKKSVVITLVFLCVGILGLFVGTYTGSAIRDSRNQSIDTQNEALKRQLTQNVMSRVSGLSEGAVIGNRILFELNGEESSLASVVADNNLTWVSFIEPGCEACLQHISQLITLSKKGVRMTHFILVSGTDPKQLEDLSVATGGQIRVLHDAGHSLTNEFHINAFPFHMLVDSKLQIVKLAVGVMSSETLELPFE